MCRRKAKTAVPNIFQKCSALTLEEPQEINWKPVQRLPVALLHILVHCQLVFLLAAYSNGISCAVWKTGELNQSRPYCVLLLSLRTSCCSCLLKNGCGAHQQLSLPFLLLCFLAARAPAGSCSIPLGCSALPITAEVRS